MSDRRHLLDQEIPQLRRTARALAPDRDTADDLVQEALLRAMRDLDDEAVRGSARLRLLAYLIAADRNRRRAGERAGEVQPGTPAPSAPPGPAGPVGALARLAAEQREVAVLVVLERLTYADCAEVLGVPVAIVLARLARARAQMREFIEGVPAASPGAHLRIVK